MGSLFTTVPAVVDKLNSRFRPVVAKHSRYLALLRGDVDDFKEQVGSLFQLTADQGLLGQAVSSALAQSVSLLDKVQSLEEELLSCSKELVDGAEHTALAKDDGSCIGLARFSVYGGGLVNILCRGVHVRGGYLFPPLVLLG